MAAPESIPQPKVNGCTAEQDRENALHGPGDAELTVHVADSSFRRHLLEDSRPVCLSVGKLHLKIPRNYIYSRSSWRGGQQQSVTIEVTYPGMQPYDKVTAACFEKGYPCQKQQIVLTLGSQSSDVMFDSMHDAFRSREPIAAVSGYDKYEVGPLAQRQEFFSKDIKGGVLRFGCFPPDPKIGSPGQCARFMPFQDGILIIYRFDYGDIPNEERRDVRIRDLVESFIVRGNGQ